MPPRLTFAFDCFRKKEQLDVSTGNNVTSFRFVFFRANEQSDVIKQTNVKRGLKFACCSDRFIENYKLQKKSLKHDSCNNNNNNNHQRGKI